MISSPASVTPEPSTSSIAETDLSSSIDGAGVSTRVLVESVSVTLGPDGGLPVAVAVLTTLPPWSDCLITYGSAVQVATPPRPNDVGVHVTAPSSGSFTCTCDNGTFPVLVTVKV